MTFEQSMRRDAAYFDQWYTDMAGSPARDAIVANAMGAPPKIRFVGVLSWDALGEITEHLQLPPDGLLLDIGCGRGAYGTEIAYHTGAHLIGIDFSTVAINLAATVAATRLPLGHSEFRLGTLTATGLPTGTADGVMCVDAVQFAEPPLAALIEFRRLLRVGGRLAVTCWEAVDPSDERVPLRIRAVDFQRDLARAGFAEVQLYDKPQWRQAERELWADAIAAPSTDPAVQALQAEGRKSLSAFDSLRRVLVVATASG